MSRVCLCVLCMFRKMHTYLVLFLCYFFVVLSLYGWKRWKIVSKIYLEFAFFFFFVNCILWSGRLNHLKWLYLFKFLPYITCEPFFVQIKKFPTIYSIFALYGRHILSSISFFTCIAFCPRKAFWLNLREKTVATLRCHVKI